MKVHHDLVNEKIKRDSRPSQEGTLFTCECVLGAFLENNLKPLHSADREALEDLHKRIKAATV